MMKDKSKSIHNAVFNFSGFVNTAKWHVQQVTFRSDLSVPSKALVCTYILQSCIQNKMSGKPSV
jgi:hypothetical protein